MTTMQCRQWLQQGSAGILAMISMALLGVLGTAYVAMSSSEVSTGAQYRDGVAAQYLAEAGGRWAAIQLKNKVTAVVDASNTAAGVSYNSGAIGTAPTAGSYTVTVRRNPATPTDSERRQVLVTGTVGQANRRVVFTVTLGGENAYPVQYAGFGGNNLILRGTITGAGTIGVVNTASIHSSNSISCDRIEAGAVSGGYCRDNPYGPAPTQQITVVLPPIPVSFDINNSAYQQYRTGATNRASGALNNASVTWNGNNYISGALSLTGSTVLTTGANAGIYVDGNFALNNNTRINANGNLAIVANGTITLNPGLIDIPTGSMLTIYAKNGVTVTSGSTITGNTTIISPATISFSGDGKIIVANNGIINVYTQQNFTASGGMSFRVSNTTTEKAAFTIMSTQNISITGGTPFNPGMNGTVKFYAGGTFSLTRGAQIAGNGLVMAADTGANSIYLSGGTTAANTVFISAGDIVSESTQSGALLAANNLTIDWGSTASFSQSVLDAVGLSASVYKMDDWNNQ